MPQVDLIGYAATFIGLFTFFPQVVKTWRTKRAEGISLGMYLLFWLGVICWLSYALLTKKMPLLVNNVIMFFLISIMIILKLKYDKK